ncbi:helix-turn-helix domain-containing protein [Actinomadura scrupuli]|uniref:helix-turn-helix domain-containing protein n=1 Tax=Actinomadura scrupuli TaxID=559629 RepID=UPI003D961F2A
MAEMDADPETHQPGGPARGTASTASPGLPTPAGGPAALAKVADLLRPELPSLAEEIVDEIERCVPELGHALQNGLRGEVRHGVERGLVEFMGKITDPDAADEQPVKIYRALGRGEYLGGRSLDGLQAAYRVAGRVAWRRYADVGRRVGLPAETTYVLAEAVFTYIEEAAAQSVEAYADVQARVSSTMERRRRRLLEMLLADPPVASLETVGDLALQAKWRMPTKIAAVVMNGDRSSHGLSPAVDHDVLMDLEGAEPCLLVPDPDGPGRHEMLHRALRHTAYAIGPTVPVANAALSLRLARLALSLAERGVITSANPVQCEDHLATLLIFSEPSILRLLIERRLAPLDGLRPFVRERLTTTLLTWLTNQGNTVGMASALRVHPQTIRYRMRGIEELFGERLRDPHWRYEMETALRAAALLSTGSAPDDGPEDGAT